jgi:hypothetical protein
LCPSSAVAGVLDDVEVIVVGLLAKRLEAIVEKRGETIAVSAIVS